MPKIPFDDWLNDRLQEHDSPIDIDMEWEALAPLVTKKKDNRKYLFFFLLFVGLGAIVYMIGLPVDGLQVEMNDDNEEPILNSLKTKANSKERLIASNKEGLINPLPDTQPKSGSTTRFQEENEDQEASLVNSKEPKSNNNIPSSEIDNGQLTRTLDQQQIAKNIDNSPVGDRAIEDPIILSKTGLFDPILDTNISLDSAFHNQEWITEPLARAKLCLGSTIQLDDTLFKMKPFSNSQVQPPRLFTKYLSIQSYIGLYSTTFHTENNEADNYINERQKTEELLESFSLDVKYNYGIKKTSWNIGIGLRYSHDSYWLNQSFKDTLSEIFKDHPIEIIKYSDQSVNVSKSGDVAGKTIYTVNRRILGKRKIVSIPFDIKYRWKLNSKNSIDIMAGGAIGIMSIYSGKRIVNNAHDIRLYKYSETVKINQLISSYSIGFNYAYQINPLFELTAGLQFQQEIIGDKGVKFKWKERRKYYYIGTGINVRL